MVFKPWGGDDYVEKTEYERQPQKQNPKVDGNLISYVGKSTRKEPKRNSGKIERAYKIDDELLCYNAEAGMLLVKVKENDRKFDAFVKMPFTKGVTERKTGRTLLILGDLAHHGEAMQGQFDIAEDPYNEKQGKRFGDTIRWINAGNTEEGFIGLDYRVNAPTNHGTARTSEDVKFLAETLLQFGYDPEKRLFLLDPPHIKESADGKKFRKQGLETLIEWSKFRK